MCVGERENKRVGVDGKECMCGNLNVCIGMDT